MVGVQPEGDGDDDFKRVNIRVQPVFKPHVAAHFVVVQHVRLADGSDGGVHCRDARVEQSGDFCGGHPYLVTVYADRVVLYDDYITFHGFSVLDGATCKFLDAVQPCRKVFHVLVELLFGDFRVYLCRRYALVSQHGTHRFDGYAVGEEHRRGCRVAALMPRDMLGDAATLGDGTDSGKARVVVGNGENPAVPAQTPVFVDDALCDVEQADIGHHARLLAVDVYPLVFVEVGVDVLFRQVAHVGERQAGEGAEQVEVAVKLLLGVFQPALHQQPDFLFRQETAHSFLLLDFVLPERVACEPLVVDSDEHHRPQRADIQPHGVGAAVLVRAQEHLEVGDEGGRKLFQRDVLHAVADGEELLQVLVNGLVFQECTFGFHAGLHLFLVVLVVLAEHLHQRVVAVFQSEKGVLDLLCRDKVVTLHDFLIMSVDAHTHLVEHAVRFECRRASARDTSPFGVPQLGIDGQFAAELHLGAVHRDASHDGYCPVLFHYLTLEVVDY